MRIIQNYVQMMKHSSILAVDFFGGKTFNLRAAWQMYHTAFKAARAYSFSSKKG